MVLLNCVGQICVIVSFLCELNTNLKSHKKRETWLKSYRDQIDEGRLFSLATDAVKPSPPCTQECHSERVKVRGPLLGIISCLPPCLSHSFFCFAYSSVAGPWTFECFFLFSLPSHRRNTGLAGLCHHIRLLYVGLGYQTQVIRLTWQVLCQLNHFPSHLIWFNVFVMFGFLPQNV